MVNWFRSLSLACALVVVTVLTSSSVCRCQEKTPQTREPAFVEYLYLKPAGQFVVKSFDIGEVGIGEEVPVLIRVQNRSTTTFALSQAGAANNQARFLNCPVEIPDGGNGLVELVVKIPGIAKGLKDSLAVRASLGDNLDLQLGFSFRYRDLAAFSKSFFVFTLEVPIGEPSGRQLTVQLPFEASDMKVLSKSSVEADSSLQGLNFSIVERNGAAFVEAKGPSDLIAATKVSGKVRLKVNDKVVSETTLVIKKRTDIELLPDYVTMKFDPANNEFRGELIAKLLIGTVRIEDVRIEVEHIDDIPIELSVGKMSSSTGRIYLSVKGAVSPKDQDQILFRISSPLKTEEQVLRIKVVR
jgi:hypothetical protein